MKTIKGEEMMGARSDKVHLVYAVDPNTYFNTYTTYKTNKKCSLFLIHTNEHTQLVKHRHKPQLIQPTETTR